MSTAKRDGKTRSGKTKSEKTAADAAMPDTAPRQRARRGRGTFRSDYGRRLDAVGLGRDQPEPDTADGIRDAMARKISMAMNQWHGCREPLCRRMRGCMAPRILCSNNTKPDLRTKEEVARDVASLMRNLKAAAAASRADDGTGV